MALHSRLVLPDAALRPHCRLLLPDAVVEASVQRQLLPDAAVRPHCRLLLPDAALRLLCQQRLPDAALRLLCQQRPAQRRPAQRHPGSTASHPLRRPRPAIASRWRSATAPRPATSQLPRRPLPATASRWHSATASRLAGQQLCLGSPASNKPHSAERSTPVWLAIWRTWAGFANSQLQRATIRCTYYISAHLPCCHIGRCSDRANLSTHLHRLPTPPPYLHRMRLSPGRGAGVGCWICLSPGLG